ncbi:MAG: helix-turn-helix domain-containing protein [Reyranella sp.]
MEEVARLFGAHRNTVRAWLRSGLKTIDGGRPVLILGSELRCFLDERRAKRKRPTPSGMIFCLRCREPRRPAGDMVDYVPRTVTSGNLQGICPACEAMLYRGVALAKLDEVCADLDVTIREADLRLRQRKGPSLNHDSTTRPLSHANPQP